MWARQFVSGRHDTCANGTPANWVNWPAFSTLAPQRLRRHVPKAGRLGSSQNGHAAERRLGGDYGQTDGLGKGGSYISTSWRQEQTAAPTAQHHHPAIVTNITVPRIRLFLLCKIKHICSDIWHAGSRSIKLSSPSRIFPVCWVAPPGRTLAT